MPIRPASVGGSMFAALGRLLQEQEARKREQTIDGIALQDSLLRRQQIENRMRRQAEQDEQASIDRQRRIAAEESSAREDTNQRGIRDMAAQAISQPDF